ncbi:hypothetical protein GJ496_007720 [Pomphorhynchus laevis]|nr:hypothetical protein GJ496_007720 [Pomphorhynchus laevis]
MSISDKIYYPPDGRSMALGTRLKIILVHLLQSINGTLDTTLFASSEKIALPHHLKSWPDVVIKLNALYKEILGKNEHLYIKFKQTLQAYNSNSDLGSFTNLDSVFTKPSLKNAFTGSVLPRMISLALQVEFLFPQGLPRLVCGGDIKSLTLSQRQIACLLSNLFLCTFTDKMGSSVNLETESKNHKYIGVSFVRLFSSKKQSSVEKLKALINYFAKVTMACNTSYKQHHLILSTDDNGYRCRLRSIIELVLCRSASMYFQDFRSSRERPVSQDFNHGLSKFNDIHGHNVNTKII